MLCELEPLGSDASGARYELRVTNGTGATLAATVSAVRLDEHRPVAALAVEVGPHAALRTGFALDTSMAYERVAAEVHGEGVHIVVEAPPPRGGRSRRRWLPVAGALGAALLLAGASLVVIGAGRPRVLDAGLVATPGGALVARWRTAGDGRRSYELRNAAGAVIAAGPLPGPEGTLPLGRGDAATLHVAIANALGGDARDAAYARATAPPAIRIVATPPPRLASLSVDPPQPNQPLTVRYSARARELRLAIVDRTGATWFATTTPAGQGITQVPAPPPGPREPYALIARAAGSGAGEDTRVPIPAAVTPSPVPSPSGSGSPQPAASGAPGAPGGRGTVVDVGGGDTFAVLPDPVRPGQPFSVEVPFADGARIALVRDRDGSEVAGAQLRAGQRSVAMLAPRRPEPYTVRVTLQRGSGSETLVRPLHFLGS